MYSRRMRAMFEIEMSFGHTASHSASFEQLPNPISSLDGWTCEVRGATRSLSELVRPSWLSNQAIYWS